MTTKTDRKHTTLSALLLSLLLVGGCSDKQAPKTAETEAPATTKTVETAKAADTVAIQSSWIREVPPVSPTTAAFMQLVNASDSAHSLRAAKSPAAKILELHTHTMSANGMHEMRQVEEVTIPANGSAELKPGSFHIMMINLTEPLKSGQLVPVTLVFEDGSEVQIEAPVKHQ